MPASSYIKVYQLFPDIFIDKAHVLFIEVLSTSSQTHKIGNNGINASSVCPNLKFP